VTSQNLKVPCRDTQFNVPNCHHFDPVKLITNTSPTQFNTIHVENSEDDYFQKQDDYGDGT
jgi:hypothetical protein